MDETTLTREQLLQQGLESLADHARAAVWQSHQTKENARNAREYAEEALNRWARAASPVQEGQTVCREVTVGYARQSRTITERWRVERVMGRIDPSTGDLAITLCCQRGQGATRTRFPLTDRVRLEEDSDG